MRHLRWALGALLLGAAALALAAARQTGPEPDGRPGAAVGAAVAPDERPTPTFTVTVDPPLPIPDALPADPYEPAPEMEVATLEIPRLGLVEPVGRGMSLTAIDRGPSWWPGTALPGGRGNVVVAGHRTIHSAPFRNLHLLEPGDEVVFTRGGVRSVYQVRGVITVPADWIDIAAQTEARTATLFACHPPGSTRERIVVKLRLLGADGRPADPDEALPPMDAEAQRPDHTLVVRVPDGGSATPGTGDPFAAGGG